MINFAIVNNILDLIMALHIESCTSTKFIWHELTKNFVSKDGVIKMHFKKITFIENKIQ